MKTGTKVALFLGGLVLVGAGLGVFVHYRNKKKTKAAEKRLEEANENYIPETLGTVTAMEAGMNLASSSSTKPTELAGVNK